MRVFKLVATLMASLYLLNSNPSAPYLSSRKKSKAQRIVTISSKETVRYMDYDSVAKENIEIEINLSPSYIPYPLSTVDDVEKYLPIDKNPFDFGIFFADSIKKFYNFSAYVFKEFLKDRIFHATYIINDEALEEIAKDVMEEYRIDSFDDIQGIEKIHTYVNIPENYLVDEMDLYIQIEKDDRNHPFSTFKLYQKYNKKEIILLETNVITGERKGRFKTPEGKFFMKRVVFLPYWNPIPEWAYLPKEYKLPGYMNAYGLYMSELFRKDLPVGYEYTYPYDTKIRIHSTNDPKNFNRSDPQSSHGCIRLHPLIANRFFPFILRYTPHREVGFNSLRGYIIPFDEDRSIPVTIFRRNQYN